MHSLHGEERRGSGLPCLGEDSKSSLQCTVSFDCDCHFTHSPKASSESAYTSATTIKCGKEENGGGAEDDLGFDLSRRRRATWTNNTHAKNHFVSLLTAMYALILIMFALVVETSPAWKSDTYVAETEWLLPSPRHGGEGAGSLYLRLGAMLFGCAGIVLYGLEMFLCLRESSCQNIVFADQLLAALFTFIQMHFIFTNSKISICRARLICKLGFMHLTAANLWTWFRFVVVKQQAKTEKKKLLETLETTTILDSSSSNEDSSESREDGGDYRSEDIFDFMSGGVASMLKAATSTETTAETTTANATSNVFILPSIQYFGDLAMFLTTCLVEFALIGAAVTFIIWRSIGHCEAETKRRRSDSSDTFGRRKYKMRIDCSSSSTGLFAGLIFLIAACIAMGVYTVFDSLHNCDKARLVFGLFDLTMFLSSLLACICGLYRMRHLQYTGHARGETLDEILLVVGLIGELVYCSCEIDVFITRREDFGTMPVYVFVTYLVRLVQVTVQAIFILMSFRLHVDQEKGGTPGVPGKQFVTFLLVANATLFIFHIYEGMKQGFGHEMAVGSSHMIIIYAVTPLIVFYRFHSSVCLAEIWKHSFTRKSGNCHRSLSGGSLDSSSTPRSSRSSVVFF